MTDKKPEVTEIKVLDVADYRVGIHAVESPEDGTWKFCVEFYPEGSIEIISSESEEYTSEILDEDSYIFQDENQNIADFHTVRVYSKIDFGEFEYALEAGYDMLEALGFELKQSKEITLLRWDLDVEAHIPDYVYYDGENFISKSVYEKSRGKENG